MSGNEERHLGRWREVSFGASQIDIASAVDLLIVGMHEKDVAAGSRGGAEQIDVALHGTLSRLRDGNIFQAGFGETLMLTMPPKPIHARSLLLVGMGQSPSTHPAMGELTRLAMGAALRSRAGSAACLLGWSEFDIPAEGVPASAVSMMRGALQAIDDHAAGAEMTPLRWTFDIRNGEAERTATALRLALEAWN